MAKNKPTVPENYLYYVPSYNIKTRFNIDEDEAVTILKENTGMFNKIAQKLFKKPRISQIHLDEMGNFIWPLINGERTVYDISVLVSEKFGQKAEPLYYRLIQYLINLETYGFIVFIKDR